MEKSEISEKVGEISVFIENFREKSDKRNFCAFFFSRLTEKRYFGEISAEKTEIFVHGYKEFLIEENRKHYFEQSL